MKVGIVIHDDNIVFFNGLVQNAYFIKECFTYAGILCDFLTIARGNTLRSFDAHYSEYDVILTGSTLLSMDRYNWCVAKKIPVIDFICGNHFMTDVLLFAHGAGPKSSFHSSEVTADGAWIIPSLDWMIPYIKTLRRYPVDIVPHVWSPAIFVQRGKGIPKPNLYLQFKSVQRMRIVILEPNLNPLKTAVLPLAAAEHLYKTEEALMEKVVVSSVPTHGDAALFLKNLVVPLEIVARKPFEEIVRDANTDGVLPIFVCHHIHNPLNYLYYEILHLGFPLVHNSLMIVDNGYYYDTFESCTAQIMYSFRHHMRGLEEYKKRASTFLEGLSPENKEVQQRFIELLKANNLREDLRLERVNIGLELLDGTYEHRDDAVIRNCLAAAL